MKKLFVVVCTVLLAACSKDNSLSTNDAGNTGKNGSLTRFAIKDNFMYAIDNNYVRVFDISNNDNPIQVSSTEVAYGLETIFIYADYIYLGATDGVYVLNIANPNHPAALPKIEHHISCDPVVVQNDYAYSTQRVTATGCGHVWQNSALAVYDVSQPNNATLVEEINMVEPYGLAVEGNWLYVCDPGRGGVVVYDISNPSNPVQKTVTHVNEPRDIITIYPYMIIATDTKFELYNYADPLNMYLISTLVLS